jgi:hypothetical protein
MKKQRMFIDELWSLFEDELFRIPSTDTLFNAYYETDPEVDLPDAHLIRRNNLRNYLDSFDKKPLLLVLGEAAGPWGCRFSGVPFTSENQICLQDLPFIGKQSSNHEVPHRETSAKIFWNAMSNFHPNFFVWNTVPFHPHLLEDKLSIRPPTGKELLRFAPLLRSLLDLLQPWKVIAVGRKSELALKNLEYPCIYVRHPSHGGASEFRAAIDRVMIDL